MRRLSSIASDFVSWADGFSLQTRIIFLFLLPLLIFSPKVRGQDPSAITPEYEWINPPANLPSVTITSMNTEDLTISVATDPQGNVYTLSFGDGVDKRSATGVLLQGGFISASDLDSPLDMAIDEEGYFYIADFFGGGETFADNGKIKVFDPQGNYLPERTILTSFYRPFGVDVRFGKIYVAEYHDGTGPEDDIMSRVSIYDATTKARTRFTDQVSAPYRIAVNSEGEIYVSHTGNDDPAVIIFDENLSSLGELPNIISPGSVVIDNFDFVHVLEYGSRIDFSEFINFENLSLGDMYGIALEIEEGIDNEDFFVKIFDSAHNYLDLLVYKIDFPVDLTFNDCDRMYVNNADVTTGLFNVPTGLEFDLEIYRRIPSHDVEAPVLVCPSDTEVTVEQGETTATVNFNDPTLTDNCSATWEQTKGLGSGSEFSIGMHEIEFTATDANGNEGFCSFTITVLGAEETASFENCPSNISVNSEAGVCGAQVSYTIPNAVEGGESLEVSRVEGPAPGEIFPIGTTQVIFEAVDSNVNILTCSFDVTVVDSEAPVLSCGSDMEVETEPGEDFATVTFATPTANDNCTATVVQTEGLSSGSEFGVGTHRIVFKATDPSGSSVECDFEILVIAREEPTFVCPDEQDLPQLELDENCQYSTTDFRYLLSSFENFVNDPHLVQTEERVGNILEVGIQVFDGEGGELVGSCQFGIALEDNMNPLIDCPSQQIVLQQNDQGVYILPDYSDRVSDNCDTNPDFTQDPPPGEISADTTVSLVATDTSGNSANCSFQVVLQEPEAPSFACPNEQDLPQLELDETCQNSATDFRDLLSSFENFVNDPHLVQTEERVGNILEVEIQVFDGEGGELVGSCQFEIALEDNMDPLIDCPSQQVVLQQNDQGVYILPDYSDRVSDNCQDPEFTQNPPPGEISANTTVTLVATDAAGNTATCTFQVVLQEPEAPSFACPNGQDLPQLELNENCQYTATDFRDLLSSFENFVNDPYLVQTEERVGNLLEVEIQVFDGEGGELVGSCQFGIALEDNINPLIDCPSQQIVLQQNDQGVYILPDYIDRVSDNCDMNLNFTQTPPPGEISADTTVSLVATDASGNSANCSFQVVLQEPEAPSFACPNEQDLPQLELDETCQYSATDFRDLLSSFENFDNDPYLVQTEERVGNILEVGIQVFDREGGELVGSCQFEIVLEDIMNPLIDCPSQQIVLQQNDQGVYILPDYSDRVSDNCDTNPDFTQDPPPGEISAGTTVTLVATDAAGNTANCSFQVVLQEPEAPSFVCPDGEDLPQLELDENCEADAPEYNYLLSSFANFQEEPSMVQTEERDDNQLNITIEVYDGVGGEYVGECNFSIDLIDTYPPEIDCPTSSFNLTSNEQGEYILPDYSYLVSDNCGDELQITQNPPPGEIFESGTVTLSVLNNAGNSSTTCTFEVLLVEEGEPSFDCPTPGDIPEMLLDENCNYENPDYFELLSNFQNFEESPLYVQELQQVGDVLQVRIMVYEGDQTQEEFVGECSFQVNLIDNFPPVADCISALTVNLREDGTASISPEEVNIGSFDACGDISLDLSRSTFTEEDIQNSPISVILTATDDQGNTDTCTVLVTVKEADTTEPPAFECVSPINITLDENGQAQLELEQLYEGDLGPDGSVSSDRLLFSCDDLGENTVTLSYTGTSTGSCAITVNVIDDIAPVVVAQNIEISLDTNGSATITPEEINNGSADNCGASGLILTLEKTNFGCEDIGANPIQFVVTDASGNSSSTDVIVTVNDPAGNCVVDPVDPPDEGRYVVLFPNPGRGNVQIATSQDINFHRVEIFDMRGRFIEGMPINRNPSTEYYHLDLREYQTGVYTLKLYAADREYIRRAIITTR